MTAAGMAMNAIITGRGGASAGSSAKAHTIRAMMPAIKAMKISAAPSGPR